MTTREDMRLGAQSSQAGATCEPMEPVEPVEPYKAVK
jgi:hypothetical protein